MDLSLPAGALDWQRRARSFAEEHLFPQELPLETNGSLPEATLDRLRIAVRDLGLGGINHSRDMGGQGCTQLEMALINEEVGRATGGLWAVIPRPPAPLKHGSLQQIATFLRPSNLLHRRACVAISEPDAGSDAGRMLTRANRRGDRYVLNGEKWFVSSFSASDYIIVQANVDGDAAKPTLFLVDRDSPGVRVKRVPAFTHVYVFDHPELLLENVEVGEDRVLGPVGGGFELAKDWFIETRLQVSAHCVGAAIRALDLANAWATQRHAFGRAIRDFQGVEFMLADMAADVMAAKTLLYRIAWEIDNGGDRKLMHARTSVLKLHASEMAGRVLDKAVQIFGGRGYMRENPVERLSREVRVDRIWEGTSEIQRAIIGGQLRKRGAGVFAGWI